MPILFKKLVNRLQLLNSMLNNIQSNIATVPVAPQPITVLPAINKPKLRSYLLLFMGLIVLLLIGFSLYWFIFSNSVKAVYVTDNNPEGAGVVWQTTKATDSYLVVDHGLSTQWQLLTGKSQKISNVIAGKNSVHLARLKNLKPDSTYSFRIIINGIVKNRVIIKTAPTLASVPTPMPLLAEVYYSNNQEVEKAVVLAQLLSKADKDKKSTILAAKINEAGKMTFDFSNIRSDDLKEGFKYNNIQDVIKLTLVSNLGFSSISMKLEDAMKSHKLQFQPPSTAALSDFLVGKAKADQVCREVITTQNVCTPVCRSCSGENANDAGCDGDPDHPDICDGQDCRDEDQRHEECSEVEAPKPPVNEAMPEHVEQPPANVDAASTENEASTYESPSKAVVSEVSSPEQAQLAQGTAGVQLAQAAPVQPAPPVVQPIPTPTPTPLPRPATEGLTGVSAGAESAGANAFTIIGSARGSVEDREMGWDVNFGDGSDISHVNSKNPLKISKTYSKNGTYTVTVVVTDPRTGRRFSDRVAVSVQGTPTNSLSGVIPPPASPKTSEDSIAVDLNTREITTKASWGRTTMDALDVLRAAKGDPQATSGAVSIRYANNTKEAVIVIKNGKIVEKYDINPATGKRISLRQSYVAGAATSRVLGISNDQTSAEVVQLSSGQVAVSLPEGGVSVSAELGGKQVEVAKGQVEAGKFYEIKPNLEGKEGEIKLKGGQLFLELGWNLVALNVTPKKDYMPEDMLQEINAQGGEAVAVNRWIDNKWQTHVAGNFGTNFAIEVGHGYFVYAKKASTWVVPAGNDVTHPDILIDPGWNLLATSNLTISKASELLSHINSQSTPLVEADTVTQYANNLWQSIKLKDGVVFGQDYEVTNSRSYFVKAQNQGVWKSK